MQRSRGAPGVLVWVAGLGCAQGQGDAEDARLCRAIVLSASAGTDGHLCPLEPPCSHPVLPTFPKIVGCKAFLVCCAKPLWEGLSWVPFNSDFLLAKNLLSLIKKKRMWSQGWGVKLP